MINIDALNDDEKLAALESIHKSIAESKEIQKKKITTNVELIVKALKKIESDLKQRYDETGQLIANLKNGEDGRDGKDGKDGKNGRDGRDGPVGPRGYDGLPGRNGIDGTDGVSVTDAHIDFDGSLIISLSSGRVINVGEVVAADIAEKIKVITNGGGTSQGVLDAIASLQAQIDSIASGLEYQGTWNATTNVPTLTSSVGTAGYYYIVATAGSTNLNGVTDWQIGDWAVFNGSVWQKIDQTNLVTSVAGRTGAVTLSTSDISGLGTIATQAANNVSITGGSITGITDLAIADGGTGQSTAAAAITALTGTQTSGYYLRSNGTSASLSAISAGDVPTLNQNTTGTAAGLSATLATTSGGTGLTSFTANGVVYASSTSALATGSALTFNGTTFVAPFTSLSGNGVVLTIDRIGTGGNDRTNVQFSNSGTVRGGIGTVGASDGIYFNQGTTEGMRLTSTGLGIGTSSPSVKLHVFQDSSSTSVMAGAYIQNGSFTTNTQSGIGLFVADNFSAKIYTIRSGTAAGNLVFATNGGGGTSESNVVERARIDSSGNLGIGTTSPVSILEVKAANPTLTLSASGTTGSTNKLTFKTGFSGTNGDQNIAGINAELRISGSTVGGANAFTTFYTDSTEKMRIPAYGGVQVVTTLSVGNATPSTSGAGITFPATQSASSDANTLDDYEEGTWTPSLGGTATYTAQQGYYTRIGNVITCYGTLTVNVLGTGNNKVISGLPFTSASTSGFQSGYCSYFSGLATNAYFASATPDVSSATVKITLQTGLDGTMESTSTIFTDGTRIDFGFTYRVA